MDLRRVSVSSAVTVRTASTPLYAGADCRRNSSISVLSAYKAERNSSRSGLHQRITTFRRNLSVQKFSEQEKKALSSFSSVNYSPTHSVSFIEWLCQQKQRFYTRLELDRWFLVFFMGIIIGLIASLLKQSITALGRLQWNQTKSYLQNEQVAGGFWFAVGVNCAYGIISALLVTFVHPPATGGGTPEVIAFLNGIIVHGTLSLKNLIVKFIANVFAVSSGLPAAIQAPIITYGAIVGTGIGQFQSKTLGVHPKAFTRFRNAHDRREFTTAGVAAGVSAGFNAPIGGLLFAMEDLSSFWTKASSLQTFFCCVIAAIIAELFNTAFSGFVYRKQFGTLTESVVDPITMHFLTLLPAVLLGLVGGLLGAFFTRFNTLICQQRKKLVSKIPSTLGQRCVRVLETLLVITLMTVYSVFLPYGFSCSQIQTNVSAIPELPQSVSNYYINCYNSSVFQRIAFDTLNCPVPQANSTIIYFNAMSTLIQGSGTEYLNKLWSRTTYYVFEWYICLSAFIIYFFMTIWTAGTAIAGGIFVPLLVSGSLYGRALGVGMLYIWQSITGTPYPTTEWRWMDPGVMAAIGAAGLLSGVNRLAVASTVIVMEMVGDINLVIPNLIAIFVSRGVADQLSKPLFKCQLDAKALPYLDQEPVVLINGEQLSLELFRASHVMTPSVCTIHSRETVGNLARLLMKTGHSGYPVVKKEYEENDRDEIVYGFLTRIELYIILCNEDVYKQETPGSTVTPNIPYEELSVDYIADKTAAEERIRSYARFEHYMQIYIDLDPFINISTPKIDGDYSLYRTYIIFRTLGLRHLVVVDGHNHVIGIITRKDLMQFRMQERLEALIAENGIQPNGSAFSGSDGSCVTISDSNNNKTLNDIFESKFGLSSLNVDPQKNPPQSTSVEAGITLSVPGLGKNSGDRSKDDHQLEHQQERKKEAGDDGAMRARDHLYGKPIQFKVVRRPNVTPDNEQRSHEFDNGLETPF